MGNENSINTKYKRITPEMPKMLDKEQISVYVPSGSILPLIKLTGQYSIGTKNSNNVHTGMYGLIIGANNNTNSRATIFGSDNSVDNETATPFNVVVGDRHRSKNTGYSFISGRDSDIDTLYNCFIHTNSGKIYNQRDSVFAGWALDISNEGVQGYGNVVLGHYRDGAQGQHTLRDIRLSALIGAYHDVERSYADVVFGSTNYLCNTEKCFVSGHRNYLSSTKHDTVGGLTNTVIGSTSDNGDGTGQSTSTGNAVFGTSNGLNDSQNSFVFGWDNAVSGGCDTYVSGSHNTVTNSIGVLAHGTLLNVRNAKYTTVLGSGLGVTNGTGSNGIISQDTYYSVITGKSSAVYGAVGSVVSIADSSKAGAVSRGVDTVAYSAVFGKQLNIERMAGSLVVGDGHVVHPSKYVTTDGGLTLNSSYNIIGGSHHTIYSAWRSVIAGGADENGATNYIEDIWNSTIVGTNIKAYRVAETAIFGEAHCVGSYDDTDHTNTNTSAHAVDSVLISGYSNRVKNAYCDVVSGEANLLYHTISNVVSGTRNSLHDSDRNAVSGTNNSLSNKVQGCQVSGSNHTLAKVEHSVVGGSNNSLLNGCLYDTCIGYKNTLTANQYCTVFGNECKVASGTAYNFLHGSKLQIQSGNYSAILGQSCHSAADYTFTAGFGLLNRCKNQIMAGRFATDHTNSTTRRYLFCLGDGADNSTRKDALLFYADKINGVDEYFLKLGSLLISETKMKKIMDFIETIT